MSTTAATLVDHLTRWSPPTVESARRLDPWSTAAFAALPDARPPVLDEGAPLPALWHWFTLVDHPPTAAIGADGHWAAGAFLPPIPSRRRMNASGRLQRYPDIPFGAVPHARSAVGPFSRGAGAAVRWCS